MVKKVLFVATVFRFLHFEKSDMEILKKKEYEIHTATNMTGYDWLSDDGSLDYLELHKHQIDFGRSPFSKNTFEAYRQLKALLKEEYFDVIHTHTPVASVILRLAAISTRRKGTKVIYTDHGFHFHKSSPRKNWILYYPMEYILAYYSDMIITINREDYNVIQNFPVKKKKYIPSVGVDIDSIANLIVDKKKIRGEFNIPENVFLILSIGELSIRKNQEVIIRALSKVKNNKVYYLLCGTGDRQSYLENLTKELGVNDRVIFAGYQTHDKVKQIAHSADLGALPSLIEGLGLAGIELMAASKPVIASDVHGIKDYVLNGITGIACSPLDVEGFTRAIETFISNKVLYQTCCQNALNKAKEFDIDIVKRKMVENYKEVLN